MYGVCPCGYVVVLQECAPKGIPIIIAFRYGVCYTDTSMALLVGGCDELSIDNRYRIY